MGNPTYGTLCLSAGLRLERCNPSFLWSTDSCYLAVPQFFRRFGLFRLQRLLVIDVVKKRVFTSSERASYFQPESFTNGRLVVTKNPFGRVNEITWQIPLDLEAHFPHRFFATWSEDSA